MDRQTITVHPSLDGTPTVRWELDLDAAEDILTLLAAAALAQPASAASTLMDDLAAALNEAEDLANPALSHGCVGLWPDAEPVHLGAPAVLKDDTGTLRAVLLPGAIAPLAAITTAMDELDAHGDPVDRHDPSLMADVTAPSWMVLHSCDLPGHDFHPAPAPYGEHTPGAVLLTQVSFTHA